MSKKLISGIAITVGAVLVLTLAGGLAYKLIKKDGTDPNKKTIADVEYHETFGTDFKEKFPMSALGLTDSMSAAPYALENTTLFTGKRITKIDAPVKTVTALNDEQYFTLYVVDNQAVAAGKKFTDYAYQEYKVKLPKAELGESTTVNKWISVDLSDQYIYVGENQTLAFMKESDPVMCAYASSSENHFYYNMTTSAVKQATQSIYYGIYTDDFVDLKGKTISILGDSISTFGGVSNDAANTNSTIGGNAVFYPRSNMSVDNVKETWWQQTCDLTGASLLVNNSWSGSRVLNNNGAAYLTRAQQLHDDTGDNKGTNPDIIGVYIGINDFNANLECGKFQGLSAVYSEKDGYINPTTFAQAYTIMVDKMVKQYADADIYLFTLPKNGTNKNTELLDNYNKVIREIAKNYHLSVVDLAAVEGYDYTVYTDDGLHPNEKGMDLITDLFTRTLKANYTTEVKTNE